jgi:uncharacterized protein
VTSHWFLPDTPDVVGLLRHELGVTIEGVEALVAWSQGSAESAPVVAEAERKSALARREMLETLHTAFVVPVEPEDLFALSRGIGRILEYSNDLVKESEAMACAPDEAITGMATALAQSVRELDRAIASVREDTDVALSAAEESIACERAAESAYYAGMAALLETRDQRERIARRELYRRCERIGEAVVDVGERVIYSIVKQS